MKKYFIILVLIFPSICFSVDAIDRDGDLHITWEVDETDKSVIGCVVEIKTRFTTYKTIADILVTDLLECHYYYTKRKTIWIRVWSYNSVGMFSENCAKMSVRLTSSKPPKELGVQ